MIITPKDASPLRRLFPAVPANLAASIDEATLFCQRGQRKLQGLNAIT
ncbi:hypothetical protein [Stenotrophomonas maltophilia]|nr:hypothetical protein [Stenotrophomonas maltophilia]